MTDSKNDSNKAINITHLKKSCILLGITIFLVVTLLLVAVAILVINGQKQQNIQDSQKQKSTPTETTDETTTEDESEQSNNDGGCDTCIYYITEGASSDTTADDSVWQLDISNSEKRILSIEPGEDPSINNFRFIYGGRYLAYVKENAVWIYDTKEEKEKKISPALPDHILGNYHLSQQSISPNGRYVTYGVGFLDYSKDPGEDPVPSVDLYPNIKTGHYSYDIETGKTVYLGNLLVITAWTPDSKYVFTSSGEDYHEYKLSGGTFKIDVTTGSSLIVQKHNTILGEGIIKNILPTPTGELIVLEDDTSSNISKLVYIQKNEESTTLDSGTWADIQPFFFPNKDYSQVLYRRIEKERMDNPISI